jgi:uncharacterized protein YbaR (Trm112 family)
VDAVADMAEEAGIPGQDFKQAVWFSTFAKRWTRGEIKDFLARRMPDGREIPWSYLYHLTPILDKRLRRSILDRVEKEGLSVRALCELAATVRAGGAVDARLGRRVRPIGILACPKCRHPLRLDPTGKGAARTLRIRKTKAGATATIHCAYCDYKETL